MNKEKTGKRLTKFQIGTPRKRGEGLRIGAVRYLPRGVRKNDYGKLDYFDVWLPILAPSRKLLGWRKEQDSTPQIKKRFFDRYKQELLSNTDSRQVIQTLSELSKQTPISIGCYCEDETQCHRSILFNILSEGSRGGKKRTRNTRK